MNAKDGIQISWRKLIGTALLWVAIAAAVYVPSTSGAVESTVVAGLGFLSFALGLSLFAEGVQRDIVLQLRREK